MPKIKLNYFNIQSDNTINRRKVNFKIYHKNGICVIDLHDLTVSESIDFIDHTILHYYYMNKVSSPLEIIYGRGTHNKYGYSILHTPVKNRILELQNMSYIKNWKYNKSKKGGSIIVYVNI